MSDFFAFAGEHPFLTWCLAWAIFPICSALTAPFRYAFKAYNRKVRSRNIAAHGWPTNPLMDADGDIVHPKQDDAA